MRKILTPGGGLNRRSVLMGAAAVGSGLLLPASARRAMAGNEPQRGGTLRVSMPYNPAALDPMTGRNLPDFNSLYSMFDALIDFDPDTLELRPGLARSWDFSDPLTLVLELERGVEFHDGTPFNAEAVVYNMRRFMTDPRSNVASDLAGVTEVEATGSHEVTIRLETPNAGLPAVLTNRVGCIISPASIEAAEGGNVDRNPVGTGPFRFIEWRDNDLIRVERNPNYWQPDLPYLDGIDFRIINELNTAGRTVFSGQADLATNLGAQQFMLAERDPDIIGGAQTSMIYYSAFLNYGRGPLADVRVRRAMNFALNREDLNMVIQRGLGEPTSSIFPRDFWATDPETVDYYNHDPDRARSLLREAGYDDGVDIATFGWSDQAAMQRQEVIGNQLAQVGIRLRLTPMLPAQAMQSYMIEQQGDMLISPSGGLPDPSLAYERHFGETALRNASKIEIPGFRDLMNRTLSELDMDRRTEALHDLHRFVTENALHLPQFMGAGYFVHSPAVQDLQYSILTTPKFHRVWLDRGRT